MRNVAVAFAATSTLVLAAFTTEVAGCGSGSAQSRSAAPPDAGAGALACGASLATKPTGAPWSPPTQDSQTITTTFTVTVDTTDPSLASPWTQPHAEAVAISGGGAGLSAVGGAKTFYLHPARYLVDLNLVNDAAAGLQDVVVTPSDMSGATAFYDLNADPLAASTPLAPMALGGIGPRGVSSHLRFGFDLDPSETTISITLSVTGMTTSYVSTNSAPLAVSPDGAEVWAPFGDANTVAVLDTSTDTRVAQVSVPGDPRSVAITPDGALVLVSSSACNALSVIDRASRRIVQVFTESDGIGRDPRNVVLSPDGTRAYVSAYVSDTVTALQRIGDAFAVTTTIPVTRRPVGMAVTPDGQTLFVAHFLPRKPLSDNEGWISIVSTQSMQVSGEAIIRDDADETEASCLSQVGAFSQDTGAQLRFEATPTQLAGVFLSPGGAEGWVPGLRSAGFPILEGNVGAIGITEAVKGANSPGMNFLLDTRVPASAAVRKSPVVVDITDRPESFLQCVPAAEDAEGVIGNAADGGVVTSAGITIPSESTLLSDTGVSRFAAYTPNGRVGLFLSYNADEVAVFDGATHAPLSVGQLMLSGSNPTGLVFTPNGVKAYVTYEDSTFVSVLDTSKLAAQAPLPSPKRLPYQLQEIPPTAGAAIITFAALVRDASSVPAQPPITETKQVPLVDSDPMDPKLRRGKLLFTSSNPVKYPQLTDIRESSCSSCHPNGGNDGSAWATMEGERRTIGLWGGTAKRGWLHASASHDSSYVFATTIVQDRFGGTGLSPSDADALATYVAYGIPRLQTPPVDPDLAATGKALFEAHCASCHGSDATGSGNPVSSAPYGTGADAGPTLFDVGSATSWAGITLGTPYADLFPTVAKTVLVELQGDRELGPNDPVQQVLQFTPRPERARGAFKAPDLTNVWENSVFFHDGRQADLVDAINDIAPRVGVTLSADDINALAAYLTTL